MSLELPFFITELVGSAVLQLIFIRATCKLLDIRQPIVYAATTYALMLVAFAFSMSSSTSFLPRLIIALSSSFVLPMAMSSKPLRSCVFRCSLIGVGCSLPEFAAQFVFGLLTGSSNYPTPTSLIPAVPVTMTYTVAIAVAFITFEVLIALCERSKGQPSLVRELPIIFLNVWSYLFLLLLSERVVDSRTSNPLLAATSLVAVIGTLVISPATLEVAKRDISVSKSIADRMALARQVRHIKSELSSIALHSAKVRQLRHDLANQVDVVTEFLSQGQTGAADRYLALLQARARTLAEQESRDGQNSHVR